MNTLRTASAFLLTSFLSIACVAEPREPASTEGAASFAIQGTVIGAPPPRLGVIWNAYSGPFSGVGVAVLPDRGYALEASGAPPEHALDSTLAQIADQEGLTEPRVAIGAFVGLTAEADLTRLTAEDILPGSIPDHVFVFVEADLPPESFAAAILGELGAGYHLLRLAPRGAPREVWAAHGAVCVDPEDDACAPTAERGASGIELAVDFVPAAFETAPDFEAAALPFLF